MDFTDRQKPSMQNYSMSSPAARASDIINVMSYIPSQQFVYLLTREQMHFQIC